MISEVAKTKRAAFLEEKHTQRFWKAEAQMHLIIAPALATFLFHHSYYLHK